VRSARPKYRLGRVEIAVFLSSVAVAAGLFLVTDQSVSTLRRDIPLTSVTQEIQVHLLSAHHGLLEVVGGDTKVDPQTAVLNNLDHANQDCRTLVAGGQAGVGRVEPLVDPGHAAQAAALCDGVNRYRNMAVTLLADPVANGEGTAFDVEIDELLEELIGITQDLSGSLDQAVARDASDLSLLGRSLAAGLVLLGLAVAMLAGRHRRQLATQDQELTHLAAIVKSTGDAIMTMSLSGTITSWNPAAETLYGYRSDEIVGHPADILVPAGMDVDLSDYWASGGDVEMASYEAAGVRRDGSQVPISVTMSRLFDGDTMVGISAIVHDVSESHARELELDVARKQALEASVLKSQFLATMSHEIRTPLNGVMGLNGLLLETKLDEIQRQYSEGVQNAGESLLGVINDILEFSRLEAGKVNFENVEFDPRGLVEEVATLLAIAAHTKHLELVAYCTPEVPDVLRGDPGRIRQIVLNLAGNAVKFTESGEVVILVKLDDTGADGADPQVIFEVSDSGIGIAAADQERLFESFAQADASTTRRYGGSGLGLAICQRLVEGMAGRIGVESASGAGSRFWFSLPLASVPGARRNSTPSASISLSGVRVLVVDDNAANRLILVSQLTAWDMCPDEVSDGHSALARLRAAAAHGQPYDIAVLDHLMPGMDGLALARRVFADPDLSATRMIMLTSSMLTDHSQLSEAGVDQWCTKPVRTAVLRDRLTRLLSTEPARTGPTGPEPVLKDPWPSAGSRGRILVVEDNAVNQLVAEGTVTKLGFQVDIVANGAEALVAIAASSYSAVLMDCHMPVMDGFEATRRIRSGEEVGDRRIPILAMTASVMDEDRNRCLAAGMDDYLTKPINLKTLDAMLESWIVGDASPEVRPTVRSGQ
jgi:PAS domain S-box-containing protein